MGKLRLGDFKNGIDDSVTYNSNSVTSDAYKRDCRILTHFGAHALEYLDKNGERKDAIVLFDSKQKSLIDGKEHELSGIDLQDLSIEELEIYMANIDNMLNSNEKVQFGGISTIEVNKIKSPNKRKL